MNENTQVLSLWLPPLTAKVTVLSLPLNELWNLTLSIVEVLLASGLFTSIPSEGSFWKSSAAYSSKLLQVSEDTSLPLSRALRKSFATDLSSSTEGPSEPESDPPG